MKRIHVAIMRKSWGLTEKISSGEKTIESRWYINRRHPWGVINPGDTIYFKDSGEPVRIKTIVTKIIQIENLNPQKVRNILQKYGSALGIDKKDAEDCFGKFKGKNYCILIFLKNVTSVPLFEIDKSGFGAMASWLTVENIEKIKKKW